MLINGGGILVGRVAPMVFTFLVTPIVIAVIGIDGFGAWETVLSFAIVCKLLQTSVAYSVLWLISGAFGSGDHEGALEYVRMGVFLTLISFITVTPTVWMFRQDIAEFLSLSELVQGIGPEILAWAVGVTLVGSVNDILNSFISGFQRSGAAAIVMSVSVILGNGVLVALLLNDIGLVSLLISYTTAACVAFIGLMAMSRRMLPSFTLLPKIPNGVVLRQGAPFAAFMAAGVLASIFREQADKFVMAATASPAWAGYYGIAMRLANLVLVVCGFLYVPTMSVVAALKSGGEIEKINRVYDDACTLTIVSVGLIVVVLSSVSERLTLLWIGQALPEVESMLLYMLGGITLAAVLTGGGTAICRGLGILRIELGYIAISLVLNVALKIVLVPHLGPIGTVIASYVSWGLASVVFIVAFHRVTKIDAGPSFRLALAIIAGIICIAGARLVGGLFPFSSGRLEQVLPIALLASSVSGVYLAFLVVSGAVPRDVVKGAVRIGLKPFRP
ncbi:MAG: MATE family efflux transporter [bacterium]